MKFVGSLALLAYAATFVAAAAPANKWIVTLKPSANQQAYKAKLNAAITQENSKESNTIEHKIEHEYNINDSFKGYGAQFSASFAERLRRDPNVASVEPDAEVKAFATQPNPAAWGLRRISQRDNVTPANYNYPDSAGEGSTVYVIDTGVQIDHPDFGGRAVWGKTFCDGCPDKDDQGHGTHCAGTIGSNTYGVAKKTKVVAVKVLNSQGSGSYAGVIAGINWVAEQVKASGDKRSVASMSLGGPKNDAVNKAVQAAVQAGITFAIAAGNENADACNVSPASVPEAITVGATDDKDALASFSNWGKCVDINAPGVSVLSTWNNGKTNTISGTSMATPHVAGVAALLLADTPLAPADLAKKMIDIATPNKIGNTKGSPNLILHNGFSGGNPPITTTTQPPVTTTSTAAPTSTATSTRTSTRTTTTTSAPPTPTGDCPWWWPWDWCPFNEEEQ
ncbi:peptidase S8/S53 domain-containing protein [Catenaria anguillulae PL171]|uniref:Peptidase S8/S53 domain-containing protein n=1 Tax=Catenaria anguillulae PL171 TaxID=765915 RepID=A0A1Y2HM12_9FUNG|nr:peptidase S8/S53 domain-containing protein [Catenaria anguillulae PL171]